MGSDQVHSVKKHARSNRFLAMGTILVGMATPQLFEDALAAVQRQRRIESNPCAGVHRPAGPKARDRVLPSNRTPVTE